MIDSQDHDVLQLAPCKDWRQRSFSATVQHADDLLSNSGIDRITPLPVPTHRRFDAINRQLIRTNEKPRLPVPTQPNTFTDNHQTRLHLACYGKQVALFWYSSAVYKQRIICVQWYAYIRHSERQKRKRRPFKRWTNNITDWTELYGGTKSGARPISTERTRSLLLTIGRRRKDTLVQWAHDTDTITLTI